MKELWIVIEPGTAWQTQAARAIAQAAAARVWPARIVALGEVAQELAAQGQGWAEPVWCPLGFGLPPETDYLRTILRCKASATDAAPPPDFPVVGQDIRLRGALPGALRIEVLLLPIALTAKGPLYGEAIGGVAQTYQQPLHLGDADRQPLYRYGFDLLRALGAPPAVYLVQWTIEPEPNGGAIARFDRLWPFPSAPALASVGVQSPDLFAAHVACLTGEPLWEMAILAPD